MSTLSTVELGVLGPLQVRLDGAPVTIPGTKPRAILTMLGLHGGSVVAADVLVELIWGDDPPRTAVKALQTHISSLRHTLGDGFVLTEGAGWRLRTTEIDASRYKLAAKLARDATDASEAVALFDEALGLWRGVPELPDGQRGAAEKTRWIEGHAALVEDRAEALLATGRAAEIIGDLEAAVSESPLRERRWGQLMLALYRAGRQGEALGAYRRARSLLADELGVDPGPNLRRLEAAIVAQDSSLEIDASQHNSAVTRAVTFLLTDIEGSTAAWEADADAMAVALARHDELVEQVVTSRGGRLIKTRGEGDATFSVFERPSGAAAAAIELQDAILHEPWALREALRIRVALHTGEVEFRDGDYFGRAVNRAARLRSLAVGGQILCSGATAELVIDALRDDVVLADLGMRQLKNLARPEHVFELRLQTVDDAVQSTATDAPVERPDVPAVLAGHGPFVGRGSELDRLLAAWQNAVAGGTSAVLIAGEPGVGKTRLAGEWSRHAYDQGAIVLYGRCDEDLGAPYQPFAEALRSLVPCVGSNRLRGMRGVEALIPLVPGLTDVLPDLSAPSRADPDTERYALFDAVVSLLGVASADAPVVLILDDLHWAAKPTLLLLRHLLRFGEHARVQIVGTYRSTDLDRSHPLAAMLADLHRDGTAGRIQLTGLDETDVTAYLAEAGYDDEELARALASVTGGNPFFLIEALRHVDESGGVWDPSTLPQGVREAVSRRLSRLPAETNKALAAAAVVGSRFALDLVEQVVDEDLVDAFDEACKAGIIIEEPGGRYRFNHALVRQSLLAELASVRRMRLHQRIATTLENSPGADDELLAELAHHYFECAWAGNAAKAVDYCRRAADQAMARLAYEGAADLYDQALHALDELDDELPDRDDQRAELFIARCEALLAAGDMGSAAGAVAQLRDATRDSARLAAWATCFDGQLSMLIDPERLDEIEAAVGAAANKLAELDDAAGEAKAHTVRAGCLARLGRIGDCEVALDQALTAARRAREHRRVNAVLAGAPLAALWGPNPVSRAGGRCLDVVRLLRITSDSPAVEATSTRCQAVLDAFRGRTAAARRMIDSTRRTVTELGLRHALLEVEHFAGIVELVGDDPVAAESHLRLAYNGFRRLGLDADAAEAAALLGRACLALDRDDEADQLCSESERLAGHAFRASIAWRALRAQLLARRSQHDEARRVAETAVAIAERTDALVDHGDACLALATVLSAAGDSSGARAAAERAADLYERKGAKALVAGTRNLLGDSGVPAVPATPEPQLEGLSNACVRAASQVVAAVEREAWDEVEHLFAPKVFVESRRKIVGFPQMELPARDWSRESRRYLEMGMGLRRHPVVAVRGERLALFRMEVATTDVSPGAPQDIYLQVMGLDADGRIALHMWFDIDDQDAAIAELDAEYLRLEKEHRQASTAEPDTACVRAIRRLDTAFDREAWDEVEEIVATDISVESRRRIVGYPRTELPLGEWLREGRLYREGPAPVQHRHEIVAVRGEQLALARLRMGTSDVTPGAPEEDMLLLFGLDDGGRIESEVFFDVEDMDAAMAEMNARHAGFDGQQLRAPLENAASRAHDRFNACFADRRWDEITAVFAADIRVEDRRRGMQSVSTNRGAEIANAQAVAAVGVTTITRTPLALRGDRLCLSHVRFEGRDQRPDAFATEALQINEVDAEGFVTSGISFDPDDVDAAFEELDARYLAGEAAAYAESWQIIVTANDSLNRHETLPTAWNVTYTDHRRISFDSRDFGRALEELWTLVPDARYRATAVRALDAHGAVIDLVIEGTDMHGGELQWIRILVVTHVSGQVRTEVYEEEDLDAALARFEELRPRARVENAAAHVYERFWRSVGARDWTVVAELLAIDTISDDRRRVVNAGIRRGRDAGIADMRAIAELWTDNLTTTLIAIRGDRLALSRVRHAATQTEVLNIVEIDADNRIAALVGFDIDDIDAAFEELDARYVAGEAAAHAGTWTVIANVFATVNRRQLPAVAPDWVNIDHRRGTSFAPGEMAANIRAAWDQVPDFSLYIEAVHRLSNLGAVVTRAVNGTSQGGFDAEWRVIELHTVTGDLINRLEMFDEADIDAAIAKFDELSRPARRLENAASRVAERLRIAFAAHNWDAIAALLADNISSEDRRRVVGGGPRNGRDEEIANMRAMVDLGATQIEATVLAIRGNRLALNRIRVSDSDERSEGFLLSVIELDDDNLIVAHVAFDPDDINAAFEELDSRYLAGEAAVHSDTWSAIRRATAAFNRHEPPVTTPDWVNVDHRRVAPFESGDLIAYAQAAWNQVPDLRFRIETVHRLNNLGTVATHVGYGTSGEGFDAEWRGVDLFTFEGDVVNRWELFSEDDLDAALARFEELSRPTPLLENAASRVGQQFIAHFAAGDWDAMAAMLNDRFSEDDRRRVANAGIRHGRDAEIESSRAAIDLGITYATAAVVATRGERVALLRTHYSDRDQTIRNDVLQIVEIDDAEQIEANVVFDLDDDAAFEELDARYLAGEAAAYARTWSVIASALGAINRRELFATTPDWINVDHRRVTSFASGDLFAFLRATWAQMPDVKFRIETVHRLSNFGAVVTVAVNGSSSEGFDAEWRYSNVLTVEGDLTNRSEIFDETDLDAALARFDELNRPVPQLENAASQVAQRFLAQFTTRAFDAMAEMLAIDFASDDRRRVVNSGLIRGRDVQIANIRAVVDVGIETITPTVIAIRGARLVLERSRFAAPDGRDEAFVTEVLEIVEINDDNQISAHVVFEIDDLDAAFEELDARYLAGEAAAHTRTWSAISRGYAAANRGELAPTTPDMVNIDHRQLAMIESGELIPYLRNTFDELDISTYLEAVHRLTDLGAVVTHVGSGTSKEGFDAEWRLINVIIVDGDMCSRTEIFDETDIDAALAKFDELSRPAPRLENAASRVNVRFGACFAAHDWDTITEILADDIFTDDRRPVVGTGIRRGRDAEIANMRAIVELGITAVASAVLATRGERLILERARFSGHDETPEAFLSEVLSVIEINADNRVAAVVTFDLDEIDAAFEELDARYLAGEAAAHARTWSVIAAAYAALNRREIFATTPDWKNSDHRRAIAFAPGELISWIRASWDIAPDINIHVEVVHRLSDVGAVVTHTLHGTTQEGFDAEWRVVTLITIEGELINRGELYDEEDLDAAIARFDELSRLTSRPENAAGKLIERFAACFAARDWIAMGELLAEEISVEDRRSVVSAGIRHGRNNEIANTRTIAEVGADNMTSTVIATRGKRLALSRVRFTGRDQSADSFHAEAVVIVETTADDQIAARVEFDPDGFDAAFEELDARYLAGEAATCSNTWSVITRSYAAVNRRELPETTSDLVNIDHRRGRAFVPGSLMASIRSGWDRTPDISVYIETVHRLSQLGAVITRVMNGTTQAGFRAEWRVIDLLTVDGDLISRCELFDEADLDAALAKFDELCRPTPRLENAATRAYERLLTYFLARDWDAVAETLADDHYGDDRRRVVNAGIAHGRDAEMATMRATADVGVTSFTSVGVATRGDRLALCRIRGATSGSEPFHAELLRIVEIDADERVTTRVVFDLNDIDAAFAELESRYLAGEAAAHAHTWSAIAAAYAAINRRELPPTTPDWVNIDHRGVITLVPGDLTTDLRAAWDQTPDIRYHIEAVHRLSDLGVLVTHASKGTSHEGFDAEWRQINILTVDGDLLNRIEIFDEGDLDAALARFEELHASAPRLENAASRVDERFNAYFAARDWDAMAGQIADDICVNDRRRVVNAGLRTGRDVEIANMRAAVETGVREVLCSVVATRGKRLALSRIRFVGRDRRPEAFRSEMLCIIEIDDDERIVARTSFDIDDIDTGLEELEARYLAGEAAAHPHTWAVISGAIAATNRHEDFSTTPDWVSINHHRATSFEPGELNAYIHSSWDDMPDGRTYIEAVHRLSNLGAVITHRAQGTTQGGFEAEWRGVDVMMVDGDLIDRSEMFEEADLDAALARFDELSRPVPKLENSASHVFDRFRALFAARDWTAMAEILADDMCNDDRRPVVSAEVLHGRDTDIAHMRAIAGVGAMSIASTVIATRGERLVLSRIRFCGGDQGPDAFYTEILGIVEIDADERIVARITFDAEDLDAAYAELDARYLAGDAATHAQTWSAVAKAHAALNRHELPATTSDWVNIDHRRGTAFESGDLFAYIDTAWNMMPDIRGYIESVHRLSNLGAVVTHAIYGTAQEGFDAEWRQINMLTADGDLFNRIEIFDETDLDAALATFDELSRSARQLENAASQVHERLGVYFAARDWHAISQVFVADYSHDDRRGIVNAGVQHGRDMAIADLRAIANVGATSITSVAIATRGTRLALCRARAAPNGPEAFYVEALQIVEIATDQRIVAIIDFDLDDIGAALEELDARYLAGEGAKHSHAWSVVASAYAGLNRLRGRGRPSRLELPPTTTDWVNADHRRLAVVEPGGMTADIRASYELAHDGLAYIEAVHQLSDVGAVIAHAAYGTSEEGFDAEWRMVVLLTVEGDLISRCELFDDGDVEAALAKLDELSQQTPQLENAAIRARAYSTDAFNRHDLNGFVAHMNPNGRYEDRRKGLRDDAVGPGLTKVVHALFEAPKSYRLETESVAIRGARLGLTRDTYSDTSDPDRAITAEHLTLTEVGDDDLVCTTVLFDPDDITGAFGELTTRWIASGEVAHPEVIEAVQRHTEVAKRHQWDELANIYGSAEYVNHRQLASGADTAVDDMPSMRMLASLMPDMWFELAEFLTHSAKGAVINVVVKGTSTENVAVELSWIILQIFEEDRLTHVEVFDADQRDLALARFDELNRQAPQFDNAATRIWTPLVDAFNRRDVAGFRALMAADGHIDDRRTGLRAFHEGSERERAIVALFAAPKSYRMETESVAVRGSRLSLVRQTYRDADEADRPITGEALTLTELSDDGLVRDFVLFDPDDINGAIGELTARWIATGEVAHPEVIEAYLQIVQELNRHDWEAWIASLAGATYINHRQLGSGETIADFAASVTAIASLIPNVWVEPAEILRCSASGAVGTVLAKGTSSDGVEAEIPMLLLAQFGGDRLTHFELFDPGQREVALARFDELNRPV